VCRQGSLLTAVELAYWAHELLSRPLYGWVGEDILLAQLLGFRSPRRMRNYLWGEWRMAPRLQRTVSKEMQRILAGEIICEKRLLKGEAFSRIASRGVIAENPRPIEHLGPLQAVVSVTPQGVQLRLRPRLGRCDRTDTIPPFGEIWERLNGRATRL
jgi:hypothetical protein